MSQWFWVFIATAHKASTPPGHFWLLATQYKSQLGGLVAHQKSQAGIWIQTSYSAHSLDHWELLLCVVRQILIHFISRMVISVLHSCTFLKILSYGTRSGIEVDLKLILTISNKRNLSLSFCSFSKLHTYYLYSLFLTASARNFLSH